MTITLDSIQSSSISPTTYLLVIAPIVLVSFVVFAVVAALQGKREYGE